jgi:hypothetical protein
MVSGTVLRRCGATRVGNDPLITLWAVYGPNFISSTLLFPRDKTGNYNTTLVAPHCSHSRRFCTYPAHSGDAEAGPKTGNLAGECCRRWAISRRRVERLCSRDMRIHLGTGLSCRIVRELGLGQKGPAARGAA